MSRHIILLRWSLNVLLIHDLRLFPGNYSFHLCHEGYTAAGVHFELLARSFCREQKKMWSTDPLCEKNHSTEASYTVKEGVSRIHSTWVCIVFVHSTHQECTKDSRIISIVKSIKSGSWVTCYFRCKQCIPANYLYNRFWIPLLPLLSQVIQVLAWKCLAVLIMPLPLFSPFWNSEILYTSLTFHIK